MILLVHAIEAYFLNPRIASGIFQIHPILILIILLVGEKFFGIWGLVVGAPVGYYLINTLTHPDPELQSEESKS